MVAYVPRHVCILGRKNLFAIAVRVKRKVEFVIGLLYEFNRIAVRFISRTGLLYRSGEYRGAGVKYLHKFYPFLKSIPFMGTYGP
jgi:hypothetical protein